MSYPLYSRLRVMTLVALIGAAGSCKPAADKAADSPAETEKTAQAVVPVTLTHPGLGPMSERVELNAVSSFLLKTFVKANANGYLQLVDARLGRFVNKGEELFVIKTKESQGLGNTINALDSSFHFEGVIHVKSPGSGFITQLSYQAGDYVQDGEQLALITDTRSFVFLLDLPYELKPFLPNNHHLQLQLPDGTLLEGALENSLPTVDPGSQTQHYVIRVNTNLSIPENLIAKVNLVKQAKNNTVFLPKAAVLTDETQQEFWIMKLLNDSTAVKVPVKKGLESGPQVEILSPALQPSDNILLTGNYGLADTARVLIQK